MLQNDALKTALEEVRKTTGPTFECNEAELFGAMEVENRKPTLAITLVAVTGGFLGALAFLGFLYTIKFYDYTYFSLGTGIVFFCTALFHHHLFKNKMAEALVIGLYLVGVFLIGIAMIDDAINFNANGVLGVLLAMAIATLIWANDKVLVFIGTTIALGCSIGFLFENKTYNLIHLVTFSSTMISGALFYFEDRLIAMRNRWTEIYAPVRFALVLGGFGCVEFFALTPFFGFDIRFLWISSIAPLFWSFVILNPLIKNRLLKILVAIALVVPSIMAPSIIGSIAVLLFGFGFRNLFLLVTGGWAFVNAVFNFYQTLHMTLLHKSIILMATGVLFLVTYLLLDKSLKQNEN